MRLNPLALLRRAAPADPLKLLSDEVAGALDAAAAQESAASLTAATDTLLALDATRPPLMAAALDADRGSARLVFADGTVLTVAVDAPTAAGALMTALGRSSAVVGFDGLIVAESRSHAVFVFRPAGPIPVYLKVTAVLPA